jgi:2'-5' RNA ligase
MKHPFAGTEAVKKKLITNYSKLSLSEYLVVLSPHQALWDEITAIKKEFAEKYQCPFAYGTKPHVTLIKFAQRKMMEDRIRLQLRNIFNRNSPIKIELKDYGSFPTHTIYINITSKVPIVNIVKDLKEAQRLMKPDEENKPFFITEPHLTIARKLLPWQYEKAWLAYSHSFFTGRFIADSALMLRRTAGEKKYTLVEKFELLGQESVQVRQGLLF